MKRAVIYIFFLFATPAICLGSTGVPSSPEFPHLEKNLRDAYFLMLEHEWKSEIVTSGALDHAAVALDEDEMGLSLWKIHGGLPSSVRESPGDMVSMVSFIWAQMFGGVDVVAQVKEFAREVRSRRMYRKPHRTREKDLRSRWRFVVSCRVDELTEIAASFRNRGRLFGDGDLVFEINTLDPMSEEVGLTMAYSGGEFDIRADRMTLTDTAEAKLVLKF